MFIMIDCSMAEAEASFTLQALASFLLPALFDLLCFHLLVYLPAINICASKRMPSSARKAIQARMRYKPRHLFYHR